MGLKEKLGVGFTFICLLLVIISIPLPTYTADVGTTAKVTLNM
jgi:hypothetical protein